MNEKQISAEIIKVAKYYMDMHEVVPNSTWSNKEKSDKLVKALHSVGWQESWPYCAAFAEAVWREAYTNLGAPKPLLEQIAKGLTTSSMASATNFSSKLTRLPVPGALFFMRLGTTWQGHEGIVQGSYTEGVFTTIEGNTSPAPGSDAAKDREGDGIYAKTRKLDFTKSSTGLYLVGFLPPITW